MKCYVQEKHLDNKGNVIKTERITGDITDKAWAKKQLDYRTEQLLIAHKNDLINGGISMTDTRSQLLLKKESIIVEIINAAPTSRELLIAIAIKYASNWENILKALHRQEMPEDIYFEKVRNLKCKTLTLLDPEYPQNLKSVPQAPFVLFYYGNINLLKNYQNNIAILGTRDPSSYGKTKTRELAKELTYKGYTLVSGLTRGVATIVHNITLEYAHRNSVAVLPCGIETCFPTENSDLCKILKKYQLVISEYPGDTPADKETVAKYYRIIVGVSKTMVVTEAHKNSAVEVAASYGLWTNTDIMCVPDRADKDSLCNTLISQGAALVENTQDIIDEMSTL